MTEFSTFTTQKPRRQSPRIPGPFEARLVADASTEVRVRDLSTSGCFVDGHEHVPVAVVMKLHIELPVEGWITTQTEMVYRLGGQGVALRFVDLDDETRDQILREIHRALSQPGL